MTESDQKQEEQQPLQPEKQQQEQQHQEQLLQDAPSSKDLADISAKLKAAIDPVQFPNAHSYIDTSSDYINSSIKRMQESSNKDETAQQIANDLVHNLQSWIDSVGRASGKH